MKSAIVHGKFHHHLKIQNDQDILDDYYQQKRRESKLVPVQELLNSRNYTSQASKSRKSVLNDYPTSTNSQGQRNSKSVIRDGSESSQRVRTSHRIIQRRVMNQSREGDDYDFYKSENIFTEGNSRPRVESMLMAQLKQSLHNMGQRSTQSKFQEMAERKRLFDQRDRHSSFNVTKSTPFKVNQVLNEVQQQQQPTVVSAPMHFDKEGYEKIRRKVSQLKAHHHLLRASLNKSLAFQDKELSNLLTDKQLNLQQMQKTYVNIRSQYGMRSKSKMSNSRVDGINLDEDAPEQFQSSLAMHDLKAFKYYGGEEKLYSSQDQGQQGFRDHGEFKRFLEERAKKHKDYRQSLIFIHRKKQDKWIKAREIKQKVDNKHEFYSQDKVKQKESEEQKAVLNKIFSYWNEEQTNKLSIQDYREKMILYGLAPNSQVLDRTLKQIKVTFSIEQELDFIRKQHFESLFNMHSKYIQPLIDLIQKRIQGTKIYEDMVQKQLKKRIGEGLAKQVIIKEEKSKSPKTGKRTNKSNYSKSKEPDSFQKAFRRYKKEVSKPLPQNQSVSPSKQQEYTTMKTFNVQEAFTQVMQIWKDLDTSKTSELTKDQLMHFLKYNRIIADKLQFEEFLRDVMLIDDGAQTNLISKNQFIQMFTKPLCIIGLNHALSLSRIQKQKGGGLLSTQDPLSCQIVNHQRELLYSSFDNTLRTQSSSSPMINKDQIITALNSVKKQMNRLEIESLKDDLKQAIESAKQRDFEIRIQKGAERVNEQWKLMKLKQ